MTEETSNIEKLETDVVVIGGGGGLAAAVAAAEGGAKVILLERRGIIGGNSAFAAGMFAAESPVQARMNIDARRDEFIKTAIKYSHWKINPKIIRAFVYKSGDTIQWLEEMGLKFDEVDHFYPNQVPRCFHRTKGHGKAIVKALARRCEDLGVQLFCKTRAQKIVTDEKGSVTGVVAVTKGRELRISAKSVVIATGGYAGNKELLKKYCPFDVEDIYLNGLPHTGDGLRMATELGAATEGLGVLLIHGPFFRGSLHVAIAAMQPNTLWVNKRGERYIDEATAYFWPETANALNRQPGKISLTLFDERIKRAFTEDGIIKGLSHMFRPKTRLTKLETQLQWEAQKGMVKISDSWEDVASWMGAPSKGLEAAIEEYNSFCDNRSDDAFFKDSRLLHPLRTPPYYAVKCFQGILNTIGGIKINHRMEVLNRQDEPIPGLYAAGVDVGGWESDTYCIILTGAAFGFAVNSARIAGENAANYVSG